MVLRNRLWVLSSLPLTSQVSTVAFLPAFPAKHLDVSEEPRGWFAIYSPKMLFPLPGDQAGCHTSKKPRESRWRPWWDITKAAKLVGRWGRGTVHTTLQVILGKPDFPSVHSLSLAVS